MLTHRPANIEDQRYQMCRCSVCGREERCTPTFDFYVELSGSDQVAEGKPLVGKCCFYGRLGNRK